MIKFTKVEANDYTLIEFQCDTITPELLKSIHVPSVDGSKGVVLSGRGPIWLYGLIIHLYHPTAWIAVFDPRLGGAVVVETHSKNRMVGDVVSLP